MHSTCRVLNRSCPVKVVVRVLVVVLVVEDMATLSALKSPLGLLKFILIVSNKCSHRATAGLSHGLDGRTR